MAALERRRSDIDRLGRWREPTPADLDAMKAMAKAITAALGRPGTHGKPRALASEALAKEIGSIRSWTRTALLEMEGDGLVEEVRADVWSLREASRKAIEVER